MNILLKIWHHFRRTPYQSMAAILVMFFNFLLISAVVFVILGLGAILHYFETRPEITAFIKDTAKQEEVEKLIDNLRSRSGIKEVRFVSKEKALEIYREENKDNPLLLEMVTADILPASLEITAADPEVLKTVAQELTNLTQIFEEVVFQQDVVDALLKWTRMGEKVGLALIGFLTFVSLIVISVIVGMKITLRKKEVFILGLLGAKNSYIQNPFLLEGVLYGILGAGLGWGICVLLAFWLRPRLTPFFGDIPFWPASFRPFLAILGGEVLFGATIGFLASLIAVRKHLRR